MNKQRKTMRILLAGGGSGGHVTPLKAVAKELLKHDGVELQVICDKRFSRQARVLFQATPAVSINTIYSGKFRRYHGKSLLWHIGHLPTLLLNIRDFFLFLIGLVQSLGLLIKDRPRAIFCKGGFVCLPLGLAGHILRVPVVIHDSDTHPGLTNRLLSRWSSAIATGMPEKYYSYKKAKMHYTGIPVNSELKEISENEKNTYRKQLSIPEDKPILLVTGGGLGSLKVNQAISRIAENLIDSGWFIVHIAGADKRRAVEEARSQLPKESQQNWQIEEFVDLAGYILASDLIVSRTGASAMQEFANAKKPVITIPGKQLSGGHQLKNAAMFEESKAAIILDEDEIIKRPELLLEAITGLYKDSDRRLSLVNNMYAEFAKPKAAAQLAELILAVAGVSQ